MSVRVELLNKCFGEQRCLEDVSFTVDPGELMVLVGPSGCGKSTLLRCVAGLETPTSGNIYISDELVNLKAPKDRNIAMVFQYFAVYPHMTVRENMSMGLKYTTKMSNEEIEERVRETASLLGISDLFNRKPSQLSGGQIQRVAIGRALARNPKVFLLDEPLSNIDAKFRRELMFEIRRLQKRTHVTTIYVTHDQEEAMSIGDRIVVLKDGRIRQMGTPEEIYNLPKNRFVAEFIGTPPMNFLEVKKKENERRYWLEGRSFSYEVSKNLYERLAKEAPCDSYIMGIRPERIVLLENPQHNSIRATVNLVENMGRENHLHVRLGDESMIIKVKPAVNPSPGDEVEISFREEDLLFFEPESESRLECP